MDGFAHVTTVRELESGLRVSRRGGGSRPTWSLKLAHVGSFFAIFCIFFDFGGHVGLKSNLGRDFFNC